MKLPMTLIQSALLLMASGICGAANALESQTLTKEVTIRAPLAAVWDAWTTTDGLKFVSRSSNVELRIGGPYEWFLDGSPDENGRRGGEGSRVLAFLPGEMLAFSWTFPPAVAELRQAGETTQVVVFFDEEPGGLVRVRLNAHGWQDGDEWQRGWDYFDAAWTYVLATLKQQLEEPAYQQASAGPPDWYLENIEFLTADSGTWIADNSAYQSGEEIWDSYVIEWQAGPGGYSMFGRMYGIASGERSEASFWLFSQYWDPIEKMAVIQQYGWGIIGIGSLEQDAEDGTVLIRQKFSGFDGTLSHRAHRTSNTSDTVHRTISYDIDADDHWVVRRTYDWVRQGRVN